MVIVNGLRQHSSRPPFFNKKNREGPHFFVMKYDDGQMCSFRNHKNLLFRDILVHNHFCNEKGKKVLFDMHSRSKSIYVTNLYLFFILGTAIVRKLHARFHVS